MTVQRSRTPRHAIARATALAGVALASAVLLASSPMPATGWNQGAAEATLFQLMNGARVNNGRKAAQQHSTLVSLARWRSKDQVDRNYFDHTILGTGQQVYHWYDLNGLNYRWGGENIGWNNGYSDADSPVAIHQGFMDSPGHRANILEPSFTHGGVGAYAKDNVNFLGKQRSPRFFTELFMESASAPPPPPPSGGGGGGGSPQPPPSGGGRRRRRDGSQPDAPRAQGQVSGQAAARRCAGCSASLIAVGRRHAGRRRAGQRLDRGGAGVGLRRRRRRPGGQPGGTALGWPAGRVGGGPGTRPVRNRARFAARLRPLAGGRERDRIGQTHPSRLPAMPVILEARDLVKRYPLRAGSVDVLHGVSLSVEQGEFVAIMGASGSGKSTMLHLLGGLDRPTSGEVVIDGVNISQLDDEHATLTRRAKTGFVFQFFNLIPLLNVAENVALPFLIAGESLGDRRERVDELLELVGLADKAGQRPDQLSAGEQQRVALARALAPSPTILLADEPTGNLDFTTGTEILDLLWDSCDRLGQTIVLVTHDARAAAYADRVLVVRDGEILETIQLGRRADHEARPLIMRLAELGL